MKRFETLLPIFSLLAGTCAANASLLIHESFNYPLTDDTTMAGVATSAIGLNGDYAVGGTGTGGSTSVYAADGLSFGANFPVSGGAVRLSASTGTTSSVLGAAISVPAHSGTLWNSYLVNFTKKGTGNNPTAQARVSDAQVTGSNNRLNSIADNFSNQATGISYGSTATTAGGSILAAGTTYLILSRYTNVGMAGGGTATSWIFNIEGYDGWLTAGDGLEENLAAYSLASQTSTSTTQADFGSDDFYQLAVSNATGSSLAQTVVYDESRFGTNLNDVLPLDTGTDPDPVNVTLSATTPLSQEPTASGDAIGRFTLTRAGATTAPLRVHLTTTGTATNGVDYPNIPPSVLIPAGASTLIIQVPAYTDRLIEGNEAVTLEITQGAGYNLPAIPVATVTLADRPSGALATRSRFVQKLGAGLQQRIVVYGTSLTANGAWPAQMKGMLDVAWPGRTTLVNRGASGMASDWGIANLSTQVLAEAPDVVFLEFSVNDAVARFDISLTQARKNLEAIIDGIEAENPNCEIIIQVTNPVIGRSQGDEGWRPNLEHYQQIHRDIAAERDLLLIDHQPAWQALLDMGESEFNFYVPDGLHPNAQGEETFFTPVLLQAIGAPRAPSPSIIVDDFEATLTGEWTFSASTPGAYLGSYLVDGNSGKGTKSAIYTPEIPVAGTYPVYLRWSALANRATNVPVTVNHGNGSTLVIVNQTLNGGIWFKLGDFPLTAGTSNSVVIETTGTNGFVIADAVGVEEPFCTLRVSNGRLREPNKLRGAVATITRSGPVTQPLQVGLTRGGTAVNGTDYDLLPANVTIPAGASSVTFNIVPKTDSAIEGPESLTLEIVPAGGLRTGSVAKASLVIVDPGDSPFASWQLANFNATQLANSAISGPHADPDNDGLSNLLECFTGLSPFTRNANPVTLGTVHDGGSNYLTLTFPRAPGTGLTGVPEISQNLQSWQSGAEDLAVVANVEPGNLQEITARSLVPTGSRSREFLRLKVTY